jgi:hypothetical protein
MKSPDIDQMLRAVPADRLDDVVYIEPDVEGEPTVGFNILAPNAHPDSTEFEYVVAEIVNLVFESLTYNMTVGANAESGLRALLTLLVSSEKPYTLVDVYNALGDDSGIESVLEAESERVTDEMESRIRGWVSDETSVEPVLRRLGNFCSSRAIRELLSTPDGLSFSEITEGQKLLFVSLTNMSSGLRSAIATVIANALWQSRYAYAGSDTPFMLCLDEFDLFETEALMLSEMLSKGRSLRFAVTLSVQMIGTLPVSTRRELSNVDSFYAFSPGMDKSEAGRISQALGVNGVSLSELQPYHCFTRLYRNDGSRTDPIEVSMFPPLVPVRAKMAVAELKENSRKQYGVVN